MITALYLATAHAEMRATDDFDAVVNQSPLEVTITIGERTAVQVDGPLELTQRVTTEVRKGVLVVAVARGTVWKGGDPPTVNITVPALEQVGAESAGSVTVTGPLTAGDLQLWSRGAGSLTLGDVSGQTVSLVAEGSGDITAGTVKGETVLLASRAGSDVRATGVLGASTVYEITGAGAFDVQRHAGKAVEARVQGAGSLTVVGTTEKLLLTVDGAGRVELGGLQAQEVEAEVKGAANVHVRGEKSIVASASGASKVWTSGSGRVARTTSGAAEIAAWPQDGTAAP